MCVFFFCLQYLYVSLTQTQIIWFGLRHCLLLITVTVPVLNQFDGVTASFCAHINLQPSKYFRFSYAWENTRNNGEKETTAHSFGDSNKIHIRTSYRLPCGVFTRCTTHTLKLETASSLRLPSSIIIMMVMMKWRIFFSLKKKFCCCNDVATKREYTFN